MPSSNIEQQYLF